MERTETFEELKERLTSINLEMKTSLRDEKRFLELRKELKALRRKMARLKYNEMIISKEEGNKHGKF